jgi:membrane-associated phospholipid phosphatase
MNLHLRSGVARPVELTPPEQPAPSPVPGLLVAGALALAFTVLTWFLAGPPHGSWIDRVLNRQHDISAYTPVLHVLDRIGQRAVCLPVLALITVWVAWRHRSARPVLISVSAVVAVNLIVLVLKIWLGRGAPLAHRPAFFVGGEMYPSGHTSNIIAVYGTGVHLLSRYGDISRTLRKALYGLVALLSVVMTVTSLLLRWHWFTDLIAGFLIGGMILAVTVAFDDSTPFESPRRRSLAEDGTAT